MRFPKLNSGANKIMSPLTIHAAPRRRFIAFLLPLCCVLLDSGAICSEKSTRFRNVAPDAYRLVSIPETSKIIIFKELGAIEEFDLKAHTSIVSNPLENQNIQGATINHAQKKIWAVGDGGLIAHREFSNPEWHILSDIPTQLVLTDIQFTADGKIGYCVGTDGVILISRSSGQFWEISRQPQGKHIYSVLINKQNDLVLAGGLEEILILETGGSDWKSVEVPSAGPVVSIIQEGNDFFSLTGSGAVYRAQNHKLDSWNTVASLQVDDSFICGKLGPDGRVVAMTTLGAIHVKHPNEDTWDIVTTPEIYDTFFDFTFTAPGVAVAVGSNGALAEVDVIKGQWTHFRESVYHPMEEFDSVAFSQDLSIGAVLSDEERYFETRDRGVTWTIHPLGGYQGELKRVFVANDSNRVVIQIPGGFLVSDGRENWTPILYEPLKRIEFECYLTANLSEGIAITSEGWSYHLTDQLKNITRRGQAPYGREITTLAFDSMLKTGFLAGSRSAVGATKDGSITWRSGSMPIAANYFSSAITSDGGWGMVGGDTTAVFETNDGGSNWSASERINYLILNTSSVREETHISEIFIPASSRDSWLLSGNGQLLRGFDGGHRWYSSRLGNYRHHAVWASHDGSFACIVGELILVKDTQYTPPDFEILEIRETREEVFATVGISKTDGGEYSGSYWITKSPGAPKGTASYFRLGPGETSKTLRIPREMLPRSGEITINAELFDSSNLFSASEIYSLRTPLSEKIFKFFGWNTFISDPEGFLKNKLPVNILLLAFAYYLFILLIYVVNPFWIVKHHENVSPLLNFENFKFGRILVPGLIKTRRCINSVSIRFSNRALDDFLRHSEIKIHRKWIPIPVTAEIDSESILIRNKEALRDAFQTFAVGRDCFVQILGEGGVGKSILLREIGRWLAHDATSLRLFDRPVIPVICESPGDSLDTLVRKRLREIFGFRTISDDLFDGLTEQGVIAAFVDGFSEKALDSKCVSREYGASKVKFLFITSRTKIPGTGIISLTPTKLGLDTIDGFFDGMIGTYRPELSGDERERRRELLLRFLPSSNGVSAIIVKLVAIVDDIPDMSGSAMSSVYLFGEIVKDYVDFLLREGDQGFERFVGKINEIASLCLTETFEPCFSRLDKFIAAGYSLGDLDALIFAGILVRVGGVSDPKFGFAMDPICEILAAIHLAAHWPELPPRTLMKKSVERPESLFVSYLMILKPDFRDQYEFIE